MGYDTIHETYLSDIADIIKDGINVSKDFIKPGNGNVGYSSSLTKATKGLIMEFPVLVSKANHIESAGIVAKAYEAKFVTLLQIAFSASNITNSKEGIEYIRNFHTNLKDSCTVDEFIDMMDSFVESTNLTADTRAKYQAVTNDMRNLSYCFESDINETSLNSYKIMNNYGILRVMKETDDNLFDKAAKHAELASRQTKNDEHDRILKQSQAIANIASAKNDTEFKQAQSKLNKEKFKYQQDMDVIKNARDDRDELRQINKDARNANKQDLDMLQTSQNMLTNYIVPSDLKKANELVPTMMVVNFVYVDEVNRQQIYRQMIIGVKAKLYEVEPSDVITKLISKHVDSNLLLKLIKVNTRQISFVKDFLLAIDDAKLDALSRSKRGSTNKLFKVLERRALGGKIRKNLGFKDYCKAISSLVISQEEAEELLKNNIDVNNPAIIRPIMEKLNLISFAIIDESSESVKFLFDTGDDIYETIPLDKLEKEQKDGSSRKVINLLAKMNR